MCYQSIGRHGLVYRALRPIAKGEELCFSYPPEISNLTQLLPPTSTTYCSTTLLVTTLRVSTLLSPPYVFTTCYRSTD